MASYSAAVSEAKPPWPRCASAIAAIALGCLTPLAHAAGDDALLDLLRERGLVDPGAGGPGAAPLAALTPQGPTNAAASSLVIAALGFLDTPYQWGGNSAASGFDCSGFTQHLFDLALAQPLPRRAEEQARDPNLIDVPWEDLRPGDLVFFNTLQRSYSHVGLYIGEGRFVHAPRAGRAIRVESVHEAYWASRFDGARRAVVRERVLPPPRG